MSAANNQNQAEYLQDGNPQGSYPQEGYSPKPGSPPLPGPPPKSGSPPKPGYPPQPGNPPEPGTLPQQGNQAGHDSEKAGKSKSEAVDLGEDGETKEFDFKDQSTRKPFIRKVFFCLMCQLLITLGFVTLCIYYRGIRYWFLRKPWMVWVALGTMLVTVVVIPMSGNARRQAPKNIICLGFFTVAEGFLLGFVASTRAPEAVMMAVGVAAAVCLALTLFALQYKWDYTMIRGFLVCATAVLLMLGIVVFFVQRHIVHLAYGSIGSLIYSVYLVYDTHVMMGGKHKYSTSPEEYIFAALNLYLDFVFTFLHIISTIASILEEFKK